MQPISAKRSGFTVVELMVAIAVLSAITVGLFALVINLVGTASRTIETTKQVHETQSALATIQRDVARSNRFLATDPLGDQNPANSNWDFTGNSTDDRILIMQNRATSLSSVADNRQPLYRIYVASGSIQTGCITPNPSAVLLPGATVEAEYLTLIYYVQSGVLYKRTLVQPPPIASVGCPSSSSYPKRTCTDPSSSTKPVNCALRDVVLAQNISRFNIAYYDAPGLQAENPDIYTDDNPQAILDNIQTVKVTVQTIKDVNGKDNEFTSYIRAHQNAR